MGLRSRWLEVRHWLDLRTEWMERVWVREDRVARKKGAGEYRWAWIWLGKDASNDDIDSLVNQVHHEILQLPVPLGIGEFMITVTAWGPRRDGSGETVYLAARQSGDDLAMRYDLAQREPPKVVAIGSLARGHVVSREEWVSGGTKDQLRRTLQRYRPSQQWRIVQVSLFSVGEAYLRLVSHPAIN